MIFFKLDGSLITDIIEKKEELISKREKLIAQVTSCYECTAEEEARKLLLLDQAHIIGDRIDWCAEQLNETAELINHYKMYKGLDPETEEGKQVIKELLDLSTPEYGIFYENLHPASFIEQGKAGLCDSCGKTCSHTGDRVTILTIDPWIYTESKGVTQKIVQICNSCFKIFLETKNDQCRVSN